MPVGLLVGLLPMDPDRTDLPGEILEAGCLLADVAEVELHPDEVGERRAVDDDPRGTWVPAAATHPHRLPPKKRRTAQPSRPLLAEIPQPPRGGPAGLVILT